MRLSAAGKHSPSLKATMKITLCGSARFEAIFKVWNEILSLCGHTVYSLAVYPSDKQGNKNWYTTAEKEVLDSVHRTKIDNSEAVLFLNVFGYMGESTLAELEYAKRFKKRIYMLEFWGQGLGISPMHETWIQKACLNLIPDYRGSPVDTTRYHYPYNLIHCGCPAGDINKYIEAVEYAELKAYGNYDEKTSLHR